MEVIIDLGAGSTATTCLPWCLSSYQVWQHPASFRTMELASDVVSGGLAAGHDKPPALGKPLIQNGVLLET